MFLVAAPVKVEPAAPAPVFEGATGTMGEPVAAGPESEPAPPAAAPEPEAAAVPVARGAVPVANPVDPATAMELKTRMSWVQCQGS